MATQLQSRGVAYDKDTHVLTLGFIDSGDGKYEAPFTTGTLTFDEIATVQGFLDFLRMPITKEGEQFREHRQDPQGLQGCLGEYREESLERQSDQGAGAEAFARSGSVQAQEAIR